MKPDFAIIDEHRIRDFTVLTIDTAKATYQGHPWRSMGDWGKRKLENFLVLSRPKERLKLIYV
jgi:hypothetical protein